MTPFRALTLSAFYFACAVPAVSGPAAVTPDASRSTSVSPTGIGAPAGEFVFPRVLNAAMPTARLTDFKGKLVILDFWATWCSPCVAAMPKLIDLKEKFGDRLQVMVISSDEEEKVQAFYKRRPTLALPTAMSSETVFKPLAERFAVPTLGTYVWIDGDGIVRGITGSKDLTTKNVKAILDGQPAQLTTVKTLGPRKTIEIAAPFMIGGNDGGIGELEYHSVLTPMLPGHGTGVAWGGPYAGRRVFLYNFPVAGLFRQAVGQLTGSTLYESRTMIEPGDGLVRPDSDYWKTPYCYELIVPESRKTDLYEVMLRELETVFGMTAAMEKRKTKVLVLTRSGQGPRRSTNKKPEYDIEATWMTIRGGSTERIAFLLEGYLHRPVLDETGIRTPIDLVWEGVSPGDLDAVRAELPRHGLSLTEAERDIDMMVIRGLPGRQSKSAAMDRAGSMPRPALCGSDASSGEDTTADEEWAALQEISRDHRTTVPAEDNATSFKQMNEARRIYRENGLRFIQRYPGDSRRWKWLNMTLMTYPRYFRDPAADSNRYWEGNRSPALYDEARIAEWDSQFAVLRAELLASDQIDPEFRSVILFNEIQNLYHRFSDGEPMNLGQLIIRLYDYAATQDKGPIRAATIIENLGRRLKDRHRDRDLAALVATMKFSPNEDVRNQALGVERVNALMSSPLQLKFTALDGRKVDLAQFRGKVVLIDGWSIWCSSCVAELPNIKAIYEKYRDRGFEVVGICFVEDSKRDEAKSLRVIEEKQPNWPMWIMRDAEATAFANRYGIKAMPMMWFIGRDGKLITSETPHGMALEHKVRELLDHAPESLTSVGLPSVK